MSRFDLRSFATWAALAGLCVAIGAGCKTSEGAQSDHRLEVDRFDDFDMDSDEYVNPDEFSDGLRTWGFQDSWDLDTDAQLTESEVREGVYGEMDVDGDDQLTRDEYRTFVKAWFGDKETFGDLDDLDTNDDGVITRKEFRDNADIGQFRRWDLDEDFKLDEDELSKGFFDTWDVDRDGLLNEDEFHIR